MLSLMAEDQCNEHSRLIHSASIGFPQNNGTTQMTSAESYEELLKGSVPCPTCRGLGRVSKEHEGQLVALIPLKDKRLKPQRTTLYVCIAVMVCLVTAGMLLGFMFPRDVAVQNNEALLHSTVYTVNISGSFANFTVVNHYNFSNSNFFPVQITGAQMTSSYDEKMMVTTINKTAVTVPMRSTKVYDIAMNFIFSQDNGWEVLVKFCGDPRSWVHNIPIRFELTANYSYLGHGEQTTLTTYQQVECYNASAV